MGDGMSHVEAVSSGRSSVQPSPTAASIIEQVRRWLDPEAQPFGVVGENEAIAALGCIDALEDLPIDEDHLHTVAGLKACAEEIIERVRFEHLEASIAELGWPLSADDEEVDS